MAKKAAKKPAQVAAKTTINRRSLMKLWTESFPASDPVSLGHSEHVGQPRPKRKKSGEWPRVRWD